MKLKPLFLILLIQIFLLQTAHVAAQSIKYNWEQQYYGVLFGQRSLLFSREMRMSKLAFADLDGDNDKDIFIGQENGELAYFENQGTNTSPHYVLITQAYKAIFDQRRQGQKVKVWTKIDVGQRSAPALVDIDDDGDLDLFIGSEEGRIWFFENQGNNLVPVFHLVTTKYQGLSPGKNSTILFADINLQRKFDLVVGTIEGRVLLYVNDGTRRKARFQAGSGTTVVKFGLETHAAPALIDWDNDGDLDLVVGQKNGTLSFFLNKGDRFFPDWQFTERSFQLIDIGGESAPIFVDMNGNGDLDLVIGSANPTVFHYENKIQGKKRILWNRSTNIFNFSKLIITGNRASMTTGDLDNDGDAELIVGEKSGNLNYFKNVGNAKNPNWVLATEELIFMTGMQNSSPTLGDLDNDGDLDLLVGSKTGQIAFVLNKGTSLKPEWELKDKTFFQIDVGSNSVPRLFDIDKDGDLDLFIGNFKGRIIAYQNKGTKEEPSFTLESTRFASANANKNVVPIFYDWNRDEAPDLILGESPGSIKLLSAPSGDNTEWKENTEALADFNVGELSHPFMQDMNGDDVLDLLIGNDEGDFLLFINKGIQEKEDSNQVSVDNSIDQSRGSLVVEETATDHNIELEGDALEDLPEGEQEVVDAEEVELDDIKRNDIDPKFVRVAEPLISDKNITWSRPTMGDLDQDGDLDLLVGSGDGRVYLYENQGSEIEWDFRLISSNYLRTDRLTHASPLLTDLDDDGDLDLVVGSKSGKLRFYENQGTLEEPNFVYDETRFPNIWIGANARPSVIDLDSDGIKDLLIGNIWGKLTHIRNDSDRFEIVRRDYQDIDVGINSTPAFVDINNSGTTELMIGSDEGVISFYKNSREDLSDSWKIFPEYTLETNFRGSCPSGHDLDDDGDLDLITGSEDGRVIMYRNNAILIEEIEESTVEPILEDENEEQ
ncbi:MAG: VCBS repeat-containing protein [Proteobacteria bacterium]|nr:VCBS repeat-containing protein [Pseudomonadota bacterium]